MENGEKLSYKKKNLKGLLFFNIFHFNVGLIVLAFIMIAGFAVSFIHDNARDNEKMLMNNMSNSILQRQGEIDSVMKDIFFVSDGAEVGSPKVVKYLDSVMENRKFIKAIGIYDQYGYIKNKTSESNHIESTIDVSLAEKEDEYRNYIYFEEDEVVAVMGALKESKEKNEYVVMYLGMDFFNAIENENYYYYIVDRELNIVCSDKSNIFTEKQKEKIREASNDDHRYIYQSSKSGVFFTGYIKKISKNFSIVIEHNISNELNLKYWMGFLALIIAIGIISATIISLKIFKVLKGQIAIVNNLMDNVAKGNEEYEIPEKLKIKEWDGILEKVIFMAERIKEREEQLSIYNNELMQAHDSIESMYVKLKKTEEENRNQFIQIISSMLNLIELKDKYTAGHSIAVTKYAEIIGKEMNAKYGYKINEDKLVIGSILHDIGKIGIDENVLNKPSKLNEEEVTLIKGHPGNGANALVEINGFQVERDIINYHHEKFDGTGYPNGLKGNDIPIEARIVSVADAFDAMTSNRSYRKAMSIDEAIKELIRSKEKQFDPKIVDITVTLIKMNKLQIYKGRNRL